MSARLSGAPRRVEVEHERPDRVPARVDRHERRVLAAAQDRRRRGSPRRAARRARARPTPERAPDLLGVLLRVPSGPRAASRRARSRSRATRPSGVDAARRGAAGAEVDGEDERGVARGAHEPSSIDGRWQSVKLRGRTPFGRLSAATAGPPRSGRPSRRRGGASRALPGARGSRAGRRPRRGGRRARRARRRPARPRGSGSRAFTIVAERITSAGGSTRARISNSRLCWSCVSPRRSVPKPIGTPAARAISSEARPWSSTSFTLRLAHGREAQLAAELVDRVVGDERRHEVRALRAHPLGGRAVDQVAVLDRAHARVDRAPDRLGRVGVRHRVGAPALGLLDDRAHLLRRVLEVPDRVGGRGDAARGHDLHLRGAAPQLLARGLAHGGHTVGHVREARRVDLAGAEARRVFARREVAVAAGLAQHAAGVEDARAQRRGRARRPARGRSPRRPRRAPS